MTGLCRNMEHRPMKTVREVSSESNEKESFCSSSIPLLNYEAVYGRNASFLFNIINFIMMMYSIV